MSSRRANQWKWFSAKVLEHIEGYTVPQYGDYPDDLCTGMTVENLRMQLKKYTARLGNNARGQVEGLRDLLKIAHYACMLYSKEIDGDGLSTKFSE